jgi:hypothetical protein
LSAVTESLGNIKAAIGMVMEQLVLAHQKRSEMEVEGTRIKGYWVGESIRIDVITIK